MGLGSLLAVSLAQARGKAAECRRLLADGVDPVEARSTDRARRALQSARTISFGDCAERGSAVEAAYRRGDLFEKRRRLMSDWAKDCDK